MLCFAPPQVDPCPLRASLVLVMKVTGKWGWGWVGGEGRSLARDGCCELPRPARRLPLHLGDWSPRAQV